METWEKKTWQIYSNLQLLHLKVWISPHRIHPKIEGHQGTEEKSITTKGAVAARRGKVAAWIEGKIQAPYKVGPYQLQVELYPL